MTRTLPLIRLSSINPFLLELRRRGCDAGRLLRDLHLPQDIPASQELFVASTTIYKFVERSAEVADDPYLGFAIGSRLELHTWDPIRLAAKEATTVGHLLMCFTSHAVEHSSAGRFFVETDGERAIFGLKRKMTPSIRPAQNDAFHLGLMTRMLADSVRDRWDASQVLCRLAAPDCIPKVENGIRLAKGNQRDVSITFPSSWLLQPFRKSVWFSGGDGDMRFSAPDSLIESVRIALQPHLSDTELTVDKAAKICGHDRRRLSRWLREAGTTLSKEIARLRAARAEHDLTHTDRRIADIAQSVGFKDPTTFSRAFKGWTGQSPQLYRRTHHSSS